MSDDHQELADQREDEADELERENERLGEDTDAARDALERAEADEWTPAALGPNDPANREDDEPPASEEEDPARPRA